MSEEPVATHAIRGEGRGMSWDKNTVNCSGLGAIADTLRDTGTPFTLVVVQEVPGYGLNDDDGQTHALRRLEYGEWVVLEQLVRTTDCDTDDHIISHKFRKGDVPPDFKTVEVVDNG